MNKEQAFTILANLANAATKAGMLNDINEAGNIHAALVVVANELGLVQAPAPEAVTPPAPEDGKGEE